MVRAKVLKVGDHAVEGVTDIKAKGEKIVTEPSMNSAQRRKLGDITNLQNQRKLIIHGANEQQEEAVLLSSKEYTEKLQKENSKLVKVLMEKNEIIERRGSELQKLRTNLKKLQEQNLQLAHTNTFLFAEINTSKDQLKTLQHELSCKNGLIMARKFLLEGKTLPCTCRHAAEVKDHRNRKESKTASESSKVNSVQIDEEAKNKRKVSGRKNNADSKVLDIIGKPGETIETTNRRRVSLRRSARFNIQEPGVVENLNGILDDQEIATNAAGCSTCDQSIGSKTEAVEPLDTKEIHEENRFVKQRLNTNYLSVILDRVCSTEVKPQREIKEAEDACLHGDIVEESRQISPLVSTELKRESKKKPQDNEEAEEMRNTSVGRPLRQAAGKVKSYKEVSLREKMRRDF
ncbi:unnamed protein product [Cochlearia groenlandica]